MRGERPSPINAVIDTRQDGTPVTVAERVAELVRAGQFVELAAAHVGVHKDTLWEWLKTAAKARIEARGRNLDDLDLTAHQKRCIDLSDSVLQGAAQWASGSMVTLERIGRGGIPITKTTTVEQFEVVYEPDPADPSRTVARQRLVGRTVRTTTEETLPDAKVLMWRLERRFQAYFGHKVEIETTGDATPPLEEAEVLSSVSESLEQWLKKRHGEDEDPATVPEQVAEVTGGKPEPRPKQQRDARGKVIDDAPEGADRDAQPAGNGHVRRDD